MLSMVESYLLFLPLEMNSGVYFPLYGEGFYATSEVFLTGVEGLSLNSASCAFSKSFGKVLLGGGFRYFGASFEGVSPYLSLEGGPALGYSTNKGIVGFYAVARFEKFDLSFEGDFGEQVPSKVSFSAGFLFEPYLGKDVRVFGVLSAYPEQSLSVALKRPLVKLPVSLWSYFDLDSSGSSAGVGLSASMLKNFKIFAMINFLNSFTPVPSFGCSFSVSSFSAGLFASFGVSSVVGAGLSFSR